MDQEQIIKTEEIFLDIGRKLCSIIGWREAIGHVYVLLYMKNEPLSLDDLAQKTNLSKSNVWGIVQQLLRLGAVNKVWSTENRKDHYLAERDFDLILSRGIVPLLQSKVNFLTSYLDNVQRELAALDIKNEDNETLKYYNKMLTDIVVQKDKLESILSVLGSLK